MFYELCIMSRPFYFFHKKVEPNLFVFVYRLLLII
jgi:hypothetical protein